MKSINATLLAEQKAPKAQAIARASLADNGRLHPALRFTDAWAGGNTRTANCGTFFVRVRTVLATGKIQYQKITDPTIESQWETWADLGTNVANVLAFGLFWTGTYVVANFQVTGTLNIRYRRTTDGASWSAEATAYTGISPEQVNIWPADGGSAQSGIFVTYANQLYWGAYNPGADTWTALSSAAVAGLINATQEGDAFYDADNSRHVIMWNPNGLFPLSRKSLTVSTRTTAGVWTHHRVFVQSDVLGVRYISVSKTKINGLWWCTFARLHAWGSAAWWMACSDDGLFWEAPTPLSVAVAGAMNIIGTFTGVTGHWLASEQYVLKSTAQTYWSNQPVVRYDFTAGSTTARVGGGRAPHLTVVVQASGLATPQLNSVLTLERGFKIQGTDYYVSAGVYYVTGFRYLLDGNLLELQAIDTVGLLTQFVSDISFNFTNHTIKNQIEAVCALAGAHVCAFDANAIWSDTITAFTHPSNENARISLQALQERTPFDYTVTEAGALSFYVPTTGPSAGYVYGRAAGEHVYWPGEFGRDLAASHVRVIGSPPRTVGGESMDTTEIDAAGRRQTLFILDRTVKSTADADQLAAAWLDFMQERAKAGYLEAPPNFSLEVGDVISFNNARYEGTAGPWRVEQIQELFNPPNSRKFVQRIHLRGTA